MQLYHWNTKQLNLQPNKIESFVLMQMSAFPKRAITHIWLNAYVPEQSRYTFVTLINKHLVCIHGYSFIIIEIGYRNSYNGQEITGICLSVCLFGLSVTLSNNFFSTQKGLNWNFWQMFTSTCVMGSQIGDNLNIFILELLPLFCKKLWQGAGRWRVHSSSLESITCFHTDYFHGGQVLFSNSDGLENEWRSTGIWTDSREQGPYMPAWILMKGHLEIEICRPVHDCRGIQRQRVRSSARMSCDDLTYIVYRLPPLIQVGRLSVTCIDGLHAPVCGIQWRGKERLGQNWMDG